MKTLRQNNNHSSVTAAGTRFGTFVVILLLSVSGYSHAWSQIIVAPNELAEADGNTSRTTPDSDGPGARLKEIYDASQLRPSRVQRS